MRKFDERSALCLVVLLGSLIIELFGEAPQAGDEASGPTHVNTISIGERHVLKNTRNGVFLLNKEDTYVGRSLDLYGEWCHSEVLMFKRIVRAGDVVMDVGANIGAFSIPLAKMATPTGALVAFEPQRQLYQLLSANVALNELTNCFTYQKAVGRGKGIITVPKVNYSVPGNFGGISLLEEEKWGIRGPVEVVETIMLDDLYVNGLLSKCPSFLKIDVEGMELDVLLGSMRMIKACKPVIHVENNCKRDSKLLIDAIASFVEEEEEEDDEEGKRKGKGEAVYEIFWDVHTYFNPKNYFGHRVDIFTDGLLSMNLVCVPKRIRGDLLDYFEGRNMVKVDVSAGKYHLADYTLNWKGDNVMIEQLGNSTSCKR